MVEYASFRRRRRRAYSKRRIKKGIKKMKTTTYYTGADINKDAIFEGINSYTSSSYISYDDMVMLLDKISNDVNEKLPEDFAWSPRTSSVICNIDTQKELDMDWLKEIIFEAVRKYVDEYDEQHMEGEC